MRKKLKLVIVGGGSGVYRIAKPLAKRDVQVKTVHSMFDNGGNTGEIRAAYRTVALGDLGKGFRALTPIEWLDKFFGTRYDRPRHPNQSVVNHIIRRYFENSNWNIPEALDNIHRLCCVNGGNRVIPVSLDYAHLAADLLSLQPTQIVGEDRIDQRQCTSWTYGAPIYDVCLIPGATLYEEARDALLEANIILFCCGDFYTSLIPNLLVSGFKEVIAKTKAKLVCLTNIMTKQNETNGWCASLFVRTLKHYLGKMPHLVIANNGTIPEEIAMTYIRKERSFLVEPDEKLHTLGPEIILEDLVEVDQGHVRHNREKVADLLCSLPLKKQHAMPMQHYRVRNIAEQFS